MKTREGWRRLLIVLTTIFLFLGSVFVLIFVNRYVAERKNRELVRILDQTAVSIQERVKTGVNFLYDLRGFVLTADVNPIKWRNYFEASNLEKIYPNIYSIAYIEKVRRDGLGEFEMAMRKFTDPKYANYLVFPKNETEFAYPIKFLHTTDSDVDVLLGFDFQYSERTLAAFDLAILTGGPALSEMTFLNLIIPDSKKIGYEIVLPVMRQGSLIGFVGAWIQSESLRGQGPDMPGIKYSLFDGQQKVFSSGQVDERMPLATLTKEIELLNGKFNLILETDRSYKLPILEETLSVTTLAVIILVNIFWIISVYSILSSRRRAIRLANLAVGDLRKFKQAVDGVSDHVIITDSEGIIIYANEAAAKITGYPIEEMIGKRPSLWGKQMSKEFYEQFWKTIKYDKKPFYGEITNRRKNGEVYEAEMRVSPILDEKGNLLFFVGIERDLSNLRAIERIKTEFIALASHQLRTPLSAVKWFAEMLLSGDAGKLSKLQNQYVEKIKESNEKEIQIVNALLNVSKVESGKIALVPKMTNLRELTETILGDMKVTLVGENRKFRYKVEKNVPNIKVDPDLIRLVYSNILMNSVIYTNPGDSISAKVYVKNKKIVTEVTDTGIGIPKAEQDRVFEKFFRASNALKKYTEGSGLGLYLAKIILDSSDGKIWFESTEGKGTTFWFSLPVVDTKNRPG